MQPGGAFVKKNDKPDDAEKLAWLRLIRTENIGPITFYNLVDRYGSAHKALEILPELSKRGGRKKPLKIPDFSLVEREYKALRKLGGDLLIASSPDYPLALAATNDAPPVISVLGDISLLQKPCLGVVGARNASLNGRKFAEKISRDLGQQGQTIVSGLARGIDTSAHKGALETGTVAVVAGGIDVVYPEENLGLYKDIAKRGLVVAESPFGQKPFAQSFPRRNRIVSGLSQGVVVVEATMRSGSLITARLAGEQGRDVYAVPGHPFDPRATGPNHLIREGATLVRNIEDIFETLNSFSGTGMREGQQTLFMPERIYETVPKDMDVEPPANAHDLIMNNLSHVPVHVDDLVRATGLSVPELQTTLLDLDLAERIKRMPGNKVGLV